MSSRTNADLNPFSADDYVRKIVMVCDKHRIPIGSSENLAGFVNSLDVNPHLAMDFWSLIARMSDMEAPIESMHTRVTASDKARYRLALNGRLLETIIQGVAGQSVAEAISEGGNAPQSVMDLASLLAGADIFAPEATSMPVPATESETEDTSHIAPLLRFAEMKRTADAEAAAQVPPPVSESMVETSKVIPEPEAHPPLRRNDEHKRSVIRTELPFAGKLLRATVSSEALHQAAIAKTQDSEVRPLGVPTQTDGGASEKRVSLKFALWLLAAIVASGVGILTAQHYGMIPWRFTSGKQVLRSVRGQRVVSKAVVVPNPPAIVTASPIPDQKKNPSPEAIDSQPQTEGVLSVPASVMQAKLISSRVPIDPKMAHHYEMGGRVVMQVTVSKNGSVRHLRVISGDHALHDAAIQAVSKWRYSPYLLNGEPVDVSTLVTIELLPAR